MSQKITVLVNSAVLGPGGLKLLRGRIYELEDSEYVRILLGSTSVELIDPPYFDAVEKYRRPAAVVEAHAKAAKKAPVAPVEAPVAPVEAPVAEAPVAPVEAPVAEAPVAEAPVAEAPVVEAPEAAIKQSAESFLRKAGSTAPTQNSELRS